MTLIEARSRLAKRRAQRRLTNRASFLALVILLGPALILFTALVIIPVFEAAVFSVYKWNGLGPMVISWA